MHRFAPCWLASPSPSLPPRQTGNSHGHRAGFGPLYAVAAARLAERGATIRTGAKMRRLERAGDRFRLLVDDQVIEADRVASTVPIRRIEALCNLPISEELETITLLTLFFSFSGESGFDEAVIYNFSHKGAWKRLTMYSDFYGRNEGREYFAVEVISNHLDGSVSEAESDFRSHVAENGLFIGDLKLEGSQFLENAYPVYRARADLTAANALKALKAIGIESFGRQGGFNYQPTARVSTLEAEAALRAGI
jgi:hypothetical protein